MSGTELGTKRKFLKFLKLMIMVVNVLWIEALSSTVNIVDTESSSRASCNITPTFMHRKIVDEEGITRFACMKKKVVFLSFC